jgi:hypothetical protein
VPEGIPEGVQVKELPLSFESMTDTVLRLSAGPIIRVMVTGPVSPDHVRMKGVPSVILYAELVN